jgi:hypothetical protein
MPLNTFDVFSDYDTTLLAYSQNSHLKIRGNKFALSTISDDFKETLFRINRMGDYIRAWEDQLTNFIFQ